MKRLYTSQDPLMAGYLKGLLESHGIDCLIKNEFLAGAAGELPPIECWPELWLRDDAQLARARELLTEALTPATEPGRAWRCASCGESIEGQFTQCWRCGESRPEDPSR